MIMTIKHSMKSILLFLIFSLQKRADTPPFYNLYPYFTLKYVARFAFSSIKGIMSGVLHDIMVVTPGP